MSLVHMGGRIYDPVLGRFLQADPMIQAPENIQSLNRYAYVMNNPLNATDPSGYIWVALVIWAVKALVANTVLAAAVNFILVAYQYYGYYQMARGILAASKGNLYTMGKFAGGMAKSYLKSIAENAALKGLVALGSNSQPTKGGGSGDNDLHKSTSGDAKFVDGFIADHVNHITESSDYSKHSVQSEMPDEVRDSLIVMSGTKTGRALMEHFIKTRTTLDLVDTTLSRTLKEKNLSGAFEADYGEDSEFRDTVYYTRDLEGFRSVVRKNNPDMLNSVINTMGMDVGLVMELGHTRAGNQFGVNGVDTYIEVVPHSLVENRYRAERGLLIRRSYHRKDDMFEYMNKSN